MKKVKTSYKEGELTTDYLINALDDMHFRKREVEHDLLYYAARDIEKMQKILKDFIEATHSHIDGRNLLAELHPRNTLDIKCRVDAVETWYQADWLSKVYDVQKEAEQILKGCKE